MNFTGTVSDLPFSFRMMLIAFLVSLSFGYVTGAFFLRSTDQVNPEGIEENYLGNEDDEDAEVMKFKKSKGEILTTIHTHAFSLSMVFLVLAVLIYFTVLPAALKKFLMVEPFFSVLLTFGGLWAMWDGIEAGLYVAIISGFLMHASYITIIVVLLWQLIFPGKYKTIKA